jgi:hypothetical protein
MDGNGRAESRGNSRDNAGETLGNARVISYNLNEDERPGGMKVRFKVRVETGRKAAVLDTRQAEAIKGLLQRV